MGTHTPAPTHPTGVWVPPLRCQTCLAYNACLTREHSHYLPLLPHVSLTHTHSLPPIQPGTQNTNIPPSQPDPAFPPTYWPGVPLVPGWIKEGASLVPPRGWQAGKFEQQCG